MPEMNPVEVKDLALDLNNFRTVPQTSELSAIMAMISTSPDRFWALTESLLKDGYLATENIIVLRGVSGATGLVVKEGNRRIAALKFILGHLKVADADVPAGIAALVTELAAARKGDTQTVPCTIYDGADAATVDRIVTLAHGKGEKAGRDQWNAVARARHNRDASRVSEPPLDLLEKYLKDGKNSTPDEKARWAGDYPLSVLEEAIKKVAPRMGFPTAPALVSAYPSTRDRDPIEKILRDIGQKELGFDDIRSKDVDFAARYGVPTAPTPGAASSPAAGAPGSAGGTTKPSSGAQSQPKSKPRALSITDPKAVKRHMKGFAPKGSNREKLELLRIEAARLDVGKTPLAFSFVLRSMFEISAKAYCADHVSSSGPTSQKADGTDRALVDVLRDISNHLTKNNTDKNMQRVLHGAMTELGNPHGLFSVTSFNQLVHNPRFSITAGDVATRFGTVFPLLEEMNR